MFAEILLILLPYRTVFGSENFMEILKIIFSEQFSETLQPREGPLHFHLLLPNTKTAAGQEPSTAKGEWVKCNQKVALNTLHKKCHQLNSFLSHQHLHTYVNFRLDLNNRGGGSTDQQANLTRPGQACQPRLKKSTWPESCMIWNDVSNTFQCFSMVYELYWTCGWVLL